MNNKFLTFAHPLLEKLNDGKTIKLGFKILYWVLGVLMILAGLGYIYLFTQMAAFSTFILLLGVLLGCLTSFQIWFYRASKINEIEGSAGFVVSPLFASFVRAAGESLAAFITCAGVFAGLAAVFGSEAGQMLPGIGEMGFLAIIISPIFSFFLIVFTYFIAERIYCLPEIATNSKMILKKLSNDNDSKAGNNSSIDESILDN